MFHVGQKVVCIDDAGAEELSKDTVYTIRFIYPADRYYWRGVWRLAAGIELAGVKILDGCSFGFAPERFRPATSIAVFEQMLRTVPAPRERVRV